MEIVWMLIGSVLTIATQELWLKIKTDNARKKLLAERESFRKSRNEHLRNR